MELRPILLSTAYLPPIGYMFRLIGSGKVLIEKHENFVKQSYRNRCVVLGANGPMALVIPVEKARDTKVLITETRIYNHESWQRIHWRAIFSAYNSSPFFEYYQDYFFPFYQKHWKFLFDFNMELANMLFEVIGFDQNIWVTERFEKLPEGVVDYRYNLSPKTVCKESNKPYTQVFSEKFGFINNLSIIDLLFNLGPETLSYLESKNDSIPV